MSDADLAAVRGAGYTDPQILAIVTVTVQILLTNFINNVNRTDIDIPAVIPAGLPDKRRRLRRGGAPNRSIRHYL